MSHHDAVNFLRGTPQVVTIRVFRSPTPMEVLETSALITPRAEVSHVLLFNSVWSDVSAHSVNVAISRKIKFLTKFVSKTRRVEYRSRVIIIWYTKTKVKLVGPEAVLLEEGMTVNWRYGQSRICLPYWDCCRVDISLCVTWRHGRLRHGCNVIVVTLQPASFVSSSSYHMMMNDFD
jgi:hypothetical protein